MRILFIEDEPESVRPVIKALEKKGFMCKVVNFGEVDTHLDLFSPHLIFLDLLIGGATGEPTNAGTPEYENIWNKHFCPVIIYSAHPEHFEDGEPTHPFVKAVQKGSGSVKKVENALTELLPQTTALGETEISIKRQYSIALRDIAPYAFESVEEESMRNQLLLRCGRRRLAALLDETLDDSSLVSWEQYLFPPVIENLLLGDILISNEKNVDIDNPKNFRIILTPSCDLVTDEGGREAKVENVLVSKCIGLIEGIEKTSLKGMGANKLKKRLPAGVLRPGFFESVLALPALQGQFPHMAADLKDLELIPFKDLNHDKGSFTRVASIDSPFRELVAFAYSQVICRPGLPDRDMQEWCDDILSIAKQEQAET